MKKFIFILICLPLLIFNCGKKKDDPVKEKFNFQPKTSPVFDQESAWKFLIAQTSFGPRNPNSRAHTECLEYLKSKLLETTTSVSVQNFVHVGYNNEILNLSNLIASYQPQIGTRILLLAHWDSRPRADKEKDPKKRNQPIIGANDGASGVAVLLELGRLMKINPPPIGVDILLSDGEDYGDSEVDGLNQYFLGARNFIKTKPSNYFPIYGILLDLVGDKNLQIPVEGYSKSYAPELVKHIFNLAKELKISQFNDSIESQVQDDHMIIQQGGIPCIDLIDADLVGNSSENDARNYWHTLRDTPDKCSKESLKSIGDVLLHLIYQKPLL
jgi:glutaminyl-peptide cyclotransferase